jgi:hypothetical protein
LTAIRGPSTLAGRIFTMNFACLSIRNNWTAGLGVAGLLACGTPEPSDTATMGGELTGDPTPGTTGTSGSTGGSSTASTTGGSSDGSGSGAATTGAPTTGTSGVTTTGSTGSTATSGSTGDATETGTGGPTFLDVYEQILMPEGCTGGYCHGGMAGGLVMTDEATSYANLVEVAATLPICGLTVRVVPGAPEESIMWRRVRPAALDMGDMCAPKMPQGSMGLDDAKAQLVYDWIAAGALE